MRPVIISSIRRRFQRLSQSQGQVTHVLLTRSPLIHPASWASSFDLHVLSTPPAFVLSQDQTLRKKLQPTPEDVSELILTVDCLLTIFNPKGIVSEPTSKLMSHGVNKLALTMCTLLSSQGPDALPTRPRKRFRQRGFRSWFDHRCVVGP